MSKVKSLVRNCSPGYFVNDALSPAQLVTLEYSDGSPSDDFDIHSLLSNNEIFSAEQLFENLKSNESIGESTSCVTSEGVCIDPNLVKSNVHSNSTSLGALAEKHLKNDRALNELSDDCDFNLSDLLLNENLSVKNEKSFPQEHLNVLDLCFGIEENLPDTKLASEQNDNELLDDLSGLLNLTQVCISQSPVSLQSFNSKYLLNNKSQNFSSLFSEDITDSSPSDVYTNSSSSYNSSEIGNDKSSFSNETSSDDEFIPDIDLSFCIKKNIKDAPSDSSEDSGFDEKSFLPLKLSIPSEKNVHENDIFFMHRECSPRSREVFKVSKQSLFSKAISVKPKINEAAKEKLKKVRSELIQRSCLFNVIGCKEKENLLSLDKVVDHSNECVVMSSFLKIPNENSSFCHSIE